MGDLRVSASYCTNNQKSYFILHCFVTVTDCQKFSYFLPVTYQIDVRKVKFLQKFQSSDNHIIFEESRNWCEEYFLTIWESDTQCL